MPMADRITADRQLARILALLPRASRNGGVPLADLAREMGVEEIEILRDLAEVYTRAYYLPAATTDDIQILIEGDLVSVWSTGEFRRPVRLSPRESLALGLGLRVLATGAEGSRAEDLTRLAARLEGRLIDGRGHAEMHGFELDSAALPAGGIHEVISEAARNFRRCRMSYLKWGAAEPETREVDPYVLVSAEGRWYAIGHCHARSATRAFRLDRVLSAIMLEESYDVPAEFDPAEHLSDGRVYRADDFQEVTVRYSAGIARWMSEQGPVELLDDGSVLVRYSVADTRWLVRHALEHGPDAEVVAPPEIRSEVTRAIRKVLSGS
jgi:predicted DNA-binding transcriptional regulator YafY